MSWDGSVFYELVVGIISLFGVIERQFECMGETLSLFSSLDTGGGVIRAGKCEQKVVGHLRGRIYAWNSPSEDYPAPSNRKRLTRHRWD